ncbi:MAG TPA: GNAT family N-acetyltransferase [Candidatus Saccharimonadales bacterium]|nr:GNAT family N-acetyltransferase [Candidatus Saccharimonadales bacterium]
MSSEVRFHTITAEPHGVIAPATALFDREVFTPLPVMMIGGGYRLYTAMKGDELVGAANACGDLMDDLGYIRKIAVEPAHRNQGIGSALLHYVIDDIRDMGQARVSIYPTNNDNRRLYERLGFATDPTEIVSPNMLFLRLAHLPDGTS